MKIKKGKTFIEFHGYYRLYRSQIKKEGIDSYINHLKKTKNDVFLDNGRLLVELITWYNG